MIDIVITSEIRIYCEGLGHLIGESRDVHIVGIADHYNAAIASITATKPQILLLDMTMRRSCELAGEVCLISPTTKIVALAVSYDEGNIMQYAEAGVTCYVPREASIDELIQAIKEAAKGECYCPPKIAAYLLKKLKNLAASAKTTYMPQLDNNPPTFLTQNSLQNQQTLLNDLHTNTLSSQLTKREQQIGYLLAEGLSNKQIAASLFIEVSTVKNHVHNLLVKLQATNRSQAVFFLQSALAG
jgi:two-component system, NarL family, nitrate/nitrite response regulator NarL